LAGGSPTLGALLKTLRVREGLTLREMSARSGILVSTLSKVEHHRLTLTYDKLYQLSQRLGMRMSELFAENGDGAAKSMTERRSLGDLEHAIRVETPNYDYYYLCTELRRKRMIPVITKILAKTSGEFGELLHHAGEEFIYVLNGRIVVDTEFYDPITLDQGQSLYIDSSMGHAYLVADGCDEAEVLGVMSSMDEDLMSLLFSLHKREQDGADTTPIPDPSAKRQTQKS
jgi:transcriptional regulator with XRE-family HTH domain